MHTSLLTYICGFPFYMKTANRIHVKREYIILKIIYVTSVTMLLSPSYRQNIRPFTTTNYQISKTIYLYLFPYIIRQTIKIKD